MPTRKERGKGVVEIVSMMVDPETLYGYARLEKWAKDNGFVRPE
jgi:hypothetical protein